MTDRYRRLLRWAAPLAGAAALAFAGCQAETTTGYRSAVTGEACVPDETYQPRPGKSGDAPGQSDKDKDKDKDDNGRGGERSPTGIPGDNMDDEHSGKVDCLGDGNSGQGDDKKHNCEFPPGCDQSGCCDEDLPPTEPDGPDSDDPGSDDPGSDDPGSDDPGSDDPGSDDPDSDDPDADDPGSDTPPDLPPGEPICDRPCDTDAACGAESVCLEGCCELDIQ